MDNKNLTITMTGSMLMGAGLFQISTSTTIGLILIGVGAILQILVAVLQKQGINVESNLG